MSSLPLLKFDKKYFGRILVNQNWKKKLSNFYYYIRVEQTKC